MANNYIPQLPSDTELWQEIDNDGTISYYLVYQLPSEAKSLSPNLSNFTWRYKVTDLKEITASGTLKPDVIFKRNGDLFTIEGRSSISGEDYNNSFYFGNHTQLSAIRGQVEDGAVGYDYFIEALNTEAKTQPWLFSINPTTGQYDYLAVVIEAALEGRTARESELSQTYWWQTHTELERQALRDQAKDPKTFAQNSMTVRQNVIQKMVDAGIQTLDPGLIDKIVEKVNLGTLTDSQLELTISKLANPRIRFELNPEIKAALEGKTLEVIEQTKAIENTITAILGPGIADKFNLDDLANRYAANPIWFQEEFLPSLQDQFQSKYSQYKGTNVKSYEDIAPEYRGEWEGVTGQLPDETSAAWKQFLATNDIAERRDIAFAEAAKLGTQTYRDYVKRDMEVKFGKAGQRAVGGGRFQ